MPVDDAKIDETLQKLRTKEVIKTQENAEIRRVIHSLESIRKNEIRELIDPADPSVGRKTVKVLPKDDSLGITMTTARRQIIYDKAITDSTPLLA